MPQLLTLPFSEVRACPLCDNSDFILRATFPRLSYWVGKDPLVDRQPRGPLSIYECSKCGLWYKNRIPFPTDLVTVLADHRSQFWSRPSRFYDETELIRSLFPDRRPAILDVGAHSGEALAAFAPLASSLSAQDILAHPQCARQITGRYFIGFPDQLTFAPSASFELITAFDVFEHFYRPRRALGNLLDSLAPDGFFIMETGNADFVRQSRVSAEHWWYLHFFDHHQVLTPKTITWISQHFSLKIVSILLKPHKNAAYEPWFKRILFELFQRLFFLPPTQSPGIDRGLGNPARYYRLRRLFHLAPIPPRSYPAADHLRVVFQKP